MIVDELELKPDGSGRVTKSARVLIDGRALVSVGVRVPAEMSAGIADDATASVPLALLLAMRFGDDLEVDGRVDPDLYARLDLIQSYYRAMDPSLRQVEVRAGGLLDPAPPPAAFAGVCLSRGVDSLHACARGRTAAGQIDCAVFVDGLEPLHDARVRAQEVALAQQAADRLGLPLVLVEATLLRTLSDGIFDWEDAHGAGLAWIAHALSGGLGRFVLPSGYSVHTVGPSGSAPFLDPLFSSGRTAIEHADVVASRMEKVSWLANNRPDLLPWLKVCFEVNRADNCCACMKCLRTMACLRAAGALEQATAFEAALDLEALSALSLRHLMHWHEFNQIRDAAAAAGDRELATAVSKMLERQPVAERLGDEPVPTTFYVASSNMLVSLIRNGSANGSVPSQSHPIGLLAAFDRRARRLTYSTSRYSAEALLAELGALMPAGHGAQIRAWITGDGRLVTDRYAPEAPSADRAARVRFCLQPLVYSNGSLVSRARVALRRTLDMWLLPPLPSAGDLQSSPLAGYLFEEPREDRVALWSGVHPVVGDQLLAWSREAIERAGYAGAQLLGYLAATAPHTGQLGTLSTPVVPWAGAGGMILDLL